MTVLVTGGAGYIGSHMVHELVDRGERAVVLDNLSTGFRWAIPGDVPLVHGDTGDAGLTASVIAQHGVDAVIHFAASVVVPESVANPLAYYRNNTANARTLIEAAVTAGVRHFVAGADPKLRTGQSTPGATHLIKVAVETVCGVRPKIEVYGRDYPTPDGTCIRDYIHVSDLVRAHSAALRYLRAGGGSVTLNCGYGRGFSVTEVIETVKTVSGVDFRVEHAPRRPGDPAHIVAACERARALIGWRPELDNLPTIVAHALAWERKLRARTDH